MLIYEMHNSALLLSSISCAELNLNFVNLASYKTNVEEWKYPEKNNSQPLLIFLAIWNSKKSTMESYIYI